MSDEAKVTEAEVLRDNHLHIGALKQRVDKLRRQRNEAREAAAKLAEALRRIEDNPCCGSYGPCGAADLSVSIAEDALEVYEAREDN